MAHGQYAAPQPEQSNVAGMIGFILSLIGLIFGVTAPIGAIVSLIGLRNEPKGLAVAGTIIGLILTVIWGAIWFLVGAWILACMGFANAASSTFGNAVTMGAAESAIQMRYNQDDELPSAPVGNELISDYKDSWGNSLRYEPGMDGKSFKIRSAGADGQFDTGDDIVNMGTPMSPGSDLNIDGFDDVEGLAPDGTGDGDDPGDDGDDPGDDGSE